MIRSFAAALALLSLLAAGARAQLQPGHWQYRLSVTRLGTAATQELGTRDVAIAAASYGPTPSWLIVATGGRDPLASLDSLYLGTADLRPQHWSSTLGLARVVAAFALDTIFGATSSPLGRQNIVLPNPGRLLVSPEHVDAMLRLAPLAAGWRDSVTMLVTDPVATVTAPATLAVSGEENVTVPAGTFDCWIVDLSAARGEERLWVDKTGRVVVRAEQPVPQVGSDAVLRRELVSIAP